MRSAVPSNKCTCPTGYPLLARARGVAVGLGVRRVRVSRPWMAFLAGLHSRSRFGTQHSMSCFVRLLHRFDLPTRTVCRLTRCCQAKLAPVPALGLPGGTRGEICVRTRRMVPGYLTRVPIPQSDLFTEDGQLPYPRDSCRHMKGGRPTWDHERAAIGTLVPQPISCQHTAQLLSAAHTHARAHIARQPATPAQPHKRASEGKPASVSVTTQSTGFLPSERQWKRSYHR